MTAGNPETTALYRNGAAAERARIVEALATIHYHDCADHADGGTALCAGCGKEIDAHGDCPTMRIAKGKT